MRTDSDTWQGSSLASTPAGSAQPSPRKAASKRPPQVTPLRLSELLNHQGSSRQASKKASKSGSKRTEVLAVPLQIQPQPAPVQPRPDSAAKDPQLAFNTQLLEAQVTRLQQEAAAREARIQRLHAQCQREEAAAGVRALKTRHVCFTSRSASATELCALHAGCIQRAWRRMRLRRDGPNPAKRRRSSVRLCMVLSFHSSFVAGLAHGCAAGVQQVSQA